MLLDKLNDIRHRYERLTVLLSDPEVQSDSKKYQKLAKEQADLTEIAQCHEQYLLLQKEQADNNLLVEDLNEEPEIRDLAKQEIVALTHKIRSLEEQITELLLPKDPDDARNTILEIRAGTGGEEAALFVRDLFRMYSRYADGKRWSYTVLSEQAAEKGGFKEIILSIEGKDVFSRLKFEGGVHRVQRVPKTEAQGRIHTSAATVAVLPDVEEVEVDIKQTDLRVDVFRSSGPGGQSVNTTDSAVRITHLPSGLVVTCQNEKSQLKNKNQAMKVLRARLYEIKIEEQHNATAQQRKSMVGTGDRSERIRTYNFPQGRLTDHRINLTLYQLEDIVAGNLDPVINPLLAHHRAALLQAESALAPA